MALNSRGLQMIEQALSGMQAGRAARDQQQAEAQQRYYAQLLGSMPQSQRLATVLGNPDWQQSGKINIPDYQQTDAEKVQALAAADSLNRFPTLAPEIRNAGAYQTAYGAAEPTPVMQTDIRRQTLSPADFASSNRIEGGVQMKPVEVATTTETNRHNTTEEKQTAPVRMAEAGLNTAKTTLTGAETRKVGAETTGIVTKNQLAAAAAPVDSRVVNYVTQIRDAANSGRDASAILKGIPDKKVRQAVNDELVKPQNAELYQVATVPPAARQAIAEIDPLIVQAKKVMTAYEPFKTQNGLTDRDTLSYLAYRAGKKPLDGSPAAELANTQMLGVQAGARLLKGGSRAYQALKMAMQHAPDGAVDTRANIYDKSVKLVAQLINVKNSQLGWSGSGEPPIGAMKSFPNGVVVRWDGKGWAGVD